MVTVITPRVVPRDELGKYMAIVSSIFALSSILGPVLGGAITRHPMKWRWVFLLKYVNSSLGLLMYQR
jgi:MFS family permease